MEEKMNILFVCTGNTCRSPMAEAVLKNKSSEFKVKSAGIHASPNAPLSEGTKKVLENESIKLDHKSQQVTSDLITWADVVLTMTHSHKDLLTKLFPNDQTKYFTLKEYNKAKENRALSRYKIALDELKRKEAKFVEPEKGFATELQRELAITDLVKKELEKIQQDLFTEDIQDPFGQDHAVYQVTYEELKNEINKLINNKQ